MTLSQLRYFIAVARERHFGRAAQACHIAQPSLSSAIKKLEKELDVLLFERSHNEVQLTPAGEALVRQAQLVVREAETLKTLAIQNQDPLAGPLRIGVIYTVAPYLLPELIPVLHERAPQMPLMIREGYTRDLRVALRAGELDAIIISLPFTEPGVVTLPLYDEPFVAVLPASHPLIQREALEPADLARDRLLMLGAGHCFRDQLLAQCPECAQPDTSFSGALEGSSLETIRHMVASGMGVTILPCTAASGDRTGRHLLKVRRFDNPPSRRVAVAWRTGFPRTEAIETLRRAALAADLTCVRFIRPGEVPPVPSQRESTSGAATRPYSRAEPAGTTAYAAPGAVSSDTSHSDDDVY